MNYSNKANLPFALAVWCAHNEYNFKPDARKISATSLLAPLRSTILLRKYPEMKDADDLIDRFASRRGTAIHDSIEKALLTDSAARKAILEDMGWLDESINSIIINPPQNTEYPLTAIPLYVEQRFSKTLDDWTISGQFDLVFNGELHDFKTTSVVTYIKDSRRDDYILQGSIYRWIAPDIVKSDTITINYIFTDWNKTKAETLDNYPKYPMLAVKYPLLSLQETEDYLKARLNLITLYETQNTLPECSEEELWKAPPEYKYYSDGGVKCLKKFSSYEDALAYKTSKGKGFIKTIEASPKRCLYCSASKVCTQKDKYFTTE